jgi:hypothetical protein
MTFGILVAMVRVDFLTHPHHRFTQSFDWLYQALGMEVRILYGDSSTLESYLPSLASDPPRLLILFQLENLAAWASCFCPVLIFPMHDFTRLTPDSYLASLRRVEWVCFCRALHHRLAGLGLSSRYLQYAPDPQNYPQASWDRPLRAFFWERMPAEFDDRAAQSLLQSLGLRDLEVRKLDDARFAPTHSREGNSGVKGWGSRDEYLRKLSEFNIFFAPRRFEGLGLTVLEAMAMGLCVVAEDLPTANEYLLPLWNGILYRGDTQTIHPLSPLTQKQLSEMGNNARTTVQLIHQKWMNEREEIGQVVSRLCSLPCKPIRPPAGLLEATLKFDEHPEKLWKLGRTLHEPPQIWRSRRIESFAEKRRGLFGKIRWFLKSPRRCLQTLLERQG